MKKPYRGWLSLWAMGAMAVLTALTLTTATYAWFSANREVQTGRVTSRTGSTTLELQISRSGGNGFSPGTMTDGNGESYNAVELTPCDKELMPVSTANLATFLYCPVSDGDGANRFVPTPDESLYYHDTIYLRAVGEGIPDGSQLELYLDNDTENPIVRAEAGNLLAAARLGLCFDGGTPTILKLSDEPDQGDGNTYLDDQLLGGGKVLDYQNESPVAVDDPAVLLADVQFASDNANRKALTTLSLNQVYQVDLYFYLEGCDPDCLSERVGLTEAYLNLAFFGLLTQ